VNVVGLLSDSDRYVSPYSLDSLTGDRPPVFHHQYSPSQSVCFRSAVDHYRYEQPPSPSHPLCFRQFVARQPFRGLPQRQPAASSSSNSSFSPTSSSSAALAAGPVDYSPRAGAGKVEGGQSVGKASSDGGVSSTSSGPRRSSAFQDGVTVGYTYDAFFVSDGRSRRRGNQAVTSPSPPSARRQQQGATRQRYTCAECGKHYATSSNLSRHKQTHRSLDSQQARHCPYCGKVSRPNLVSLLRLYLIKNQLNSVKTSRIRPTHENLLKCNVLCLYNLILHCKIEFRQFFYVSTAEH